MSIEGKISKILNDESEEEKLDKLVKLASQNYWTGAALGALSIFFILMFIHSICSSIS